MDKRVERLEIKVDQGFKESEERDKALEEDLVATMQMVSRHQKKLARV